MKIGIRKATAEDYNALCELFDEIDTYHRENLPHIFQKPNGPVRELDYYLSLVSDENIGLFVADLDGYLVGFINVIVRDVPDIPIVIPRRIANIDSIVVKSEFRNHRIGRMLMDAMEEWTASKGAASIELNVHEFNKGAITFYERLGYKTLSRRMAIDLKVNEV